MSPRLFKKTMALLKQRMAKIQTAKINLKSKIIGILKFSTNINELDRERHELREIMKELQED